MSVPIRPSSSEKNCCAVTSLYWQFLFLDLAILLPVRGSGGNILPVGSLSEN